MLLLFYALKIQTFFSERDKTTFIILQANNAGGNLFFLFPV